MPIEPQPCGAGGDAAPGMDVEGTLLCDVDALGNVVGVALVEAVYDEATGARTGTRLVNPIDGTPYVAVGTVQPCREGCCPEPVVLCDVQDDGSAVQFVRTYTGQEDGGVQVTDQLLDGTVYAPTGTVGACDTYSQCTPSPNIDLNADCGPGEPVTQQVLLDDTSHPLSNSVFNDDASADPLCGGQWDRPGDELAAPFPVNESFRNTTFDEPGPVLQGTAPYPDLTADVDGAGNGWLQVADINSGTNGIWQVPTPFPTSDGMNAAITFASHDGTVPGGDGMAFVFTDGSVPAQGIQIGGFGNLGLQNWQGGYVAIVLDEYGQTCTCSQAAQGVIDPNPGPCGFCTNTISLQLAGAARQGASCTCCTIASMPLNPKALNQTTRATPARVLTSIIEEGGQTFVSASIDWNDGLGAVQYFDRVNVTACAGPPPATLRMAAYGGSGGAYRAVKEMRDAIARPAGVSNWRGFPITTDPVPACATLISVTGDVDVTFTADDQATGNNNPEAYLWLVNTVTGAVLARDVVSSLPSQIGQAQHLSVTADVAPADLPNLRLYVGAESRDENGIYSSLWENLDVGATATGCPADPVRTLAISAPCPLPVTIVGGSGDGGGGGTTVFNAPSTFEDAPVCMTIGGVTIPGFRREVRAADGNVEVSFLGVDGLPATPETWQAGGCVQRDTEVVELCDVQGSGVSVPFLRVFTYDENGEVVSVENQDANGNPYVPTGVTTMCSVVTLTQEVLCDQGNGGQPFLRSYVRAGGFLASVQDQELDGATAYVAVGPVGNCGTTDADREVVCWTQTSTGDQVHTGTIRHDDALPPPGWLLFDQHQTLVLPTEPGLTFVPCGASGADTEVLTLCDDGPAVPVPFLRRINFDTTGAVTGVVDTDLNGITPYVVTGDAVVCGGVEAAGRDEELLVLCDATPTRFLRRYNYDSTTGALVSIVNTTLDGSTPFAPVGAVGVCTTAIASDFDFLSTVLCDANGTQFIQRLTFNSATGAVTATTNTTLTGGAFVPVGAVSLCSNCCPAVVGSGCTSTGSGFYTAIRSTTGTISLIDSVTGAAVLAANIIPCPSDNTVRTLTAQARQLTNATPWTPGADVAGTLTSLTVTGLSGLWDLVDANGTILTGLPAGLTLMWGAEDDNTLTGPQSVTPQAGASVVANWTQR